MNYVGSRICPKDHAPRSVSIRRHAKYSKRLLLRLALQNGHLTVTAISCSLLKLKLHIKPVLRYMLTLFISLLRASDDNRSVTVIYIVYPDWVFSKPNIV